MANIKIPKNREKELEVFRNESEESILSLINALKQHKEIILFLTELETLASQSFGANGKRIARNLIALESLRREQNIDQDELIESLDESIRNLDWDQKQFSDWDKRKDYFSELLKSEHITSVAKAVDLGFDHEKIYTAGRIISDIRPVFDHDRNEVLGTLIVQNLTVEYYENGEEKQIRIALDETDLKNLRESCDLALKKAEKIKTIMEKKCNIRTILAGEGIS